MPVCDHEAAAVAHHGEVTAGHPASAGSPPHGVAVVAQNKISVSLHAERGAVATLRPLRSPKLVVQPTVIHVLPEPKLAMSKAQLVPAIRAENLACAVFPVRSQTLPAGKSIGSTACRHGAGGRVHRERADDRDGQRGYSNSSPKAAH